MSFFKSILKIIAIILVIVAIVYLLVFLIVALSSSLTFSSVGWMVGMTGANSGLIALAIFGVGVVGLSLAKLISPEGYQKGLDLAASAIGNVGSAVGNIISSGAGGIFKSIAGSPIGLAALGLGAYLLFRPSGEAKTNKLESIDDPRSRELGNTSRQLTTY